MSTTEQRPTNTTELLGQLLPTKNGRDPAQRLQAITGKALADARRTLPLSHDQAQDAYAHMLEAGMLATLTYDPTQDHGTTHLPVDIRFGRFAYLRMRLRLIDWTRANIYDPRPGKTDRRTQPSRQPRPIRHHRLHRPRRQPRPHQTLDTRRRTRRLRHQHLDPPHTRRESRRNMTTDIHVTWPDRRTRRVRRTCNRCYGSGIAVHELATIDIVSRYGTAHKQAEYGETACGINATGPNWWWRT